MKDWDEIIKRYASMIGDRYPSANAASTAIMQIHPEITWHDRTIRKKIKSSLDKSEFKSEVKSPNHEPDIQSEVKNDTPKTVADPIKHFNIDTEKYNVEKAVIGAWDVTSFQDGEPNVGSNRQVKLTLSAKENTPCWESLKGIIEDWHDGEGKVVHPLENTEGKPLVVGISDIHMGAKNKRASSGTVRTREFSIEYILKYLHAIRMSLEEYKGRPVHVFILGDIVESITGLNHMNSWQGMEEEMFLSSGIVHAYEILYNFLSKIDNLAKVYFVSGNHDRLTQDKVGDVFGGACHIISYMMGLSGIRTKHHPMILSEEIDNIRYIASHGHHKVIQQTISKIILDYGDQSKYNVIMSGHYHSRQIKKEIYNSKLLMMDSVLGRAFVLPPIFTGNFYSESLGYTSTPGFCIFEANPTKTNIIFKDYGL